jgi:hypothetical protein
VIALLKYLIEFIALLDELILSLHFLLHSHTRMYTAIPASYRQAQCHITDGYVLLITHMCFHLYRATNQIEVLVLAIALVEQAVVTSPANPQLRLLAYRLYIEAGLSNCVF